MTVDALVSVIPVWVCLQMLLRDYEQDIEDMISDRRRKIEEIRESVTELEVKQAYTNTTCTI